MKRLKPIWNAIAVLLIGAMLAAAIPSSAFGSQNSAGEANSQDTSNKPFFELPSKLTEMPLKDIIMALS